MIGLVSASLLFKGIPQTFKKFIHTRSLWVLSLYLIPVLISGFYSTDKSDWFAWVRIKLPFFVLPLAFAPIAQLSQRKFVLLLYGFMLSFFISASLVLGNYFIHFKSMTDSFSRGTQIPILGSEISHIRYTIIIAFSFFCALYLLRQNMYLQYKYERWLQAAYALFAFVALHILSVRSGLLALYLGLAYTALHEIVKRRQILVGAGIILLIGILPYTAYRYIPSLHHKIGYMRYDLQQYKEGNINEYSDAMRLLSMQIGLQIWRDNPILGVGAADLKTETGKIYEKQYPQISVANRRLPHNQFIWVLATTGIIGFVFFMAAFFVPLFSNGHYKYGPVIILHLMLLSSFFTEVTFEEQMGTAFYIIFLLLFMNHFKRE